MTARAWSDGNFRRFWVGSSASSFGAELGELALPLLALNVLSASAGEVGLLRMMQFLPFLLLTLPLGVVVDRCPKRALIVSADLGRFVLLATIGIVTLLGDARVGLVYALVFVASGLTVLSQLATFAFLPVVVAPGLLLDANSKVTATQSAAEIGGKGLGGVLVEWATAPIAVLVNAVGYLVSAVAVSRIGIPGRPEPRTRTSVWREVIDGLRLAGGNRYLRPLLAESTTFNLSFEVFVVGLMVYAVRDLGMSPAFIGLAFTVGAVGTFLGAWFGARVTGRFGYGRVLLVTLLVGNTASALVVLLKEPTSAMVILSNVLFLMGLGTGIANVHATSLRQSAVPDAVQGRVNAAYRMVSWGAVPIGAGLGGIVAGHSGPHAAMVIGALGIPLATCWIAASAIPRVRTIEEVAAAWSGSPER